MNFKYNDHLRRKIMPLNPDVIIEASNSITSHLNQILMDVNTVKTDHDLTPEQRDGFLQDALDHLNGEKESIEQQNNVIRQEWATPTGK
jgi:hypothetical protein